MLNSLVGKVIVASFALAVMAGCKTTEQSKPASNASWACSAQGLASGSYSGGTTAYIHLRAYPDGGNYPVQLNPEKNRAEGKTKDGTPFVCVKNG